MDLDAPPLYTARAVYTYRTDYKSEDAAAVDLQFEEGALIEVPRHLYILSCTVPWCLSKYQEF